MPGTITAPQRQRYALLLFALLLLFYYLDNFIWGSVLGGVWGNYVLRPLAWGSLAAFTLWLPGVRPGGKRRHRRALMVIGLACGLVAILGLLAAGIIGGFGKSPYDHSLKGIITNIIFMAGYLSGMEYARAWLLNQLFRKHPLPGIALTGLVFSLFWYPLAQITGLNSSLKAVEFAGNFFIPSLSESLLCSYLAFLGGPLPPLVYRAVFMGFQWFCPILPSSSWVIQTLIGTFVPVICMVLVYETYQFETRLHRKHGNQENVWEGVFTSAAIIILIWFSAGVFSIFPAVVVSGSMIPTIKIGDMIIIKKTDPAEIKIGDIIQFKRDKIRVIHRVVDIGQQGSKTGFVTKGDNNSSADSDLVLPEQVTGRLLVTIPKAGALSMLIRSPDHDVWKNMADIVNGSPAKGGNDNEKP